MDSTSQEINPSVLLIILILSIIFFISGLLHLLVRLLLKPSTPSSDDLDTTTALQGQLQQLFHLHDSGVDQSFIDTLPVFVYKAIIGVQDPFDCAVCLCEFEPEDKLRLLPKCSHAFHLECIDTWLLSHSTCPLCRSSLLSDVSGEISGDQVHEEEESAPDEAVPVKLGKFRSGEGSSGDSEKIDERRCFSMGSFEYVMDERLGLRVKIELPAVAAVAAAPPAENSRRRLAVSECGWSSRREEIKGLSLSSNSQRGESFSVSKIWRRLKEEEGRRTGSLGLPPPHPAAAEEDKGGSWRSTGSEFDVESGSCDGGAVSRAGETPSFARRTVQWLVGRQNKVVSHG